MTRTRALAAIALSLITAVSMADFCPPDSPESGGMRDIMLAYMGQGQWTPEHFYPYVAYLDRANGGKPADWFFDAFLLLQFGGAPSGGAYYKGNVTVADWNAYLEQLFAEGKNLAALEETVVRVAGELGTEPRTLPIIIMIPYLSASMEGFGDVDGDGTEESPASDADRVKAFNRLVDQVLERWDPARLPHLSLWGFYWMNEGIGGADMPVVKAVSEHIRARGYKLHWIPWFRAPGFDRWREAGIDFTVMQPNFAFVDTPARLAVPDQGRLTQNALLARKHGLGVEMEMNERVSFDPGQALNLALYVNHSVDEIDGTMNGAARAWYQSSRLIWNLYESTLPFAARLYDDIYRFHKGTYQRRALSLLEGARATVDGARAPELTDGLWLTRGEHSGRVLTAGNGSVAEIRLPASMMLGDIRVHIAGQEDGGIPPAAIVRISASEDGTRFEPLGEAVPEGLCGTEGWVGGFALLGVDPRPYRAVRVELVAPRGSEQCGVDEILAYPAPHPLGGNTGTVSGTPAPGAEFPHPSCLTDGVTGGADGDTPGFTFAGPGACAFTLADDLFLGEAIAHVRWDPDGPTPRARVALARDNASYESDFVEAEGDGEGWVRIALPTMAVKTVEFQASGGSGETWDEMQVRIAPNLAWGKPYEIAPAFEEDYPDEDGRSLTDGEISERGFSDKKTVGWVKVRSVSVILDAGKPVQADRVRVHLQGGGYAWVNAPSALEVRGSEDGQSWKLLAPSMDRTEVTFTERVGDELQELAWYEATFDTTPVRFVKLTCRGQGWTMLSEFEVYAQGENVALGSDYRLAPRPTAKAQYPDSGGELTDGEYPVARHDWGQAIGWSGIDPQIAVDLLKPQAVGFVRAHLQGGGPAGVWYPRQVTVQTSLDGEDWSEQTLAGPIPPETGDKGTAAFIAANLTPREARYVRISLQHRGWIMLDEVEVYAPQE